MENKGNGLNNLDRVISGFDLENYHDVIFLDALKIDELIADGVPIGPAIHPGFPPNFNVIFLQIQTKMAIEKIFRLLNAIYPQDHPVCIMNGLEINDLKVKNGELSGLLQELVPGPFTNLYIRPLPAETSFETFQQVVARLRAPDGCPWDREQTHISLRPHLLEEAYETLEAIDRQNAGDLKEELGDLLLQIVLNTQIAFEDGEFSMVDVLDGINRKIIHRHPHVFKDTQLDGVEGVLKNWEKLKEAEREEKGVLDEKGLMDGAPKSLPALSLAQEYQDRAARVGFDWPDIEPVIAKVHEELEEVKNAEGNDELTRELGDLLFAVVNLVRWHKVDAESALRVMNRRFAKRFKHIETQARKENRKLSEMTLEEMDHFWEEAKSLED
jgi:tetrapyrrole methylase family protein/MazG family protein